MKYQAPLALAVVLASTISLTAQIHYDLDSFDKVLISPKINLVLTKGEVESLKLKIRNVDPEKVNVKVEGNALHLYLDNAKKYVKHNKYHLNGRKFKEKQYQGVQVTAYLTYRDLKKLQVRGEQWVIAEDPIEVDKFKLKVYGETDINLASIKTDRLKVGLYGENDLDIDSGIAQVQRYRSFGENRVDTRKVTSRKTKTSIFGEADFNLSVTDKLKISSMGEASITFSGQARVTKGIVLGSSEIRNIRTD